MSKNEIFSDVRAATLSGAIQSMEQEARRQLRIIDNEIQHGIRGEELGARGFRSAERHSNGSRAIVNAEKTYNGGSSVVDRADR